MSKLVLFILVILLASCDCTMDQYGVVLDAKTDQPVEGVLVSISKWQETTKKNGEFEFHIVTGICSKKLIIIEKEGYKPFELEVKNEDDHFIYKVSSDYGYHEYKEPLPTRFNPKIKEQGSYFDTYSTKFAAHKPDSIVFFLEKR